MFDGAHIAALANVSARHNGVRQIVEDETTCGQACGHFITFRLVCDSHATHHCPVVAPQRFGLSILSLPLGGCRLEGRLIHVVARSRG